MNVQLAPEFIALFSGILTVTLIVIFSPIALRFSLIDIPDLRKLHKTSVPMVGGIAIYLSVVASLLIFDVDDRLGHIVFFSGFIVVLGVLDDALDLSIRLRFVAQIVLTIVLSLSSGLWIRSVGFEFWVGGDLHPWLGCILTVFAVVGLTNGFNMADGIDGLASGHLIVGIACIVIAVIVAHPDIPKFSFLFTLCGSVAGFLAVNLSLIPVRKVFLGDAGSLLLGFLMAWLLIFYSQDPISQLSPVSALWCVSAPVFDALLVMVRRTVNGYSPFFADRTHLHHLLLGETGSEKIVLIKILVVSFCANLLGLVVTNFISEGVGLILFVACFLIYLYSFARVKSA